MTLPNRIPTLVGLLLVIAMVGTVVFFTERALRAPSGAAGSHAPRQTKITNVTDTSFSVSWTTESPATGTILVSAPGRTNRIYYDERDSGGKLGSYTSHMVTVRDATASTDYTIKLMSNGKQFIQGEKPYELRTPTTLPPNPSGLEPAYGTIRTTAGTAADGALVYLTIVGGQELSALTKPTGLWLIPLTQVRTADLQSFLPTLERMDEAIFVTHESGEITATTDSLNDSPVPEMTIGQVHDFRRLNANKPTNNPVAVSTPAPLAQNTESQLPVGGAAVLGTTNGPFKVSLTSPAQKATLSTNLPLFSGTGIPNKFVALTIGIVNPQSGSTKVKSDGTWSYTPAKPLPPGKQSVTITSVDSAGKTIAVTHEFEIFKSGTQVLGDATASGTLTLTPTPTRISSQSASISATPESTLAGEPIPTSGYELPTILLIVMGLGLLVSGAVAISL
jgi:hypothetical protein